MKFKVGDRVRNINTGEEDIVELLPGMREYDIRPYFNAEDGCVLDKYGWRLRKNWELVSSPKTKTMTQKIGSMMKRLLDADTQTLVKAGLINGDLEMTSLGQQTLMAVLFDANKAALVKEAEQIISDEANDK